MKRLILLALLGCSSTPHHPDPATPPSVDRAALEAAVQGAWSFAQNNDTSTQTWTYALRAGTVDHSMTMAYVGGRTEVTKLGAGTYTVTVTGALSLRLATGHLLRFTAIITEGAICEALTGHACRTLGWNGFLAQDRDHTRYRREFEQEDRDDKGTQFFRSVALIKFPRPLPALTSEDCSLDLEIVASAIIDGDSVKPADGHYRFRCDVTPNGLGALSRVTVRGLAADAYGWTNHASTNRLVDDAHPRTQELFGRAFEPVLYFDPAAPDTLYVTMGAAYWATL